MFKQENYSPFLREWNLFSHDAGFVRCTLFIEQFTDFTGYLLVSYVITYIIT